MARVIGAAAALAFLATWTAAAQAQQPGAPVVPLRIAYINSQVILANTPGRAAAESLFAREMTQWRAEVQRLQQQLDSAVAEYSRTSVVMSPTAKTAKEAELRQLEQRARQRAAELDQQSQTREQELTAPIMQRVNAVIEGIRAEYNYALIFDAAAQTGGLVTADRALDISPLVIQRLQAGAGAPPEGVVQPGVQPPLVAPGAAADSTRPRPAADTTRPRPATQPLRPRRP
jgi:Skp family chaperone for outer membrane proteins